jgi:hypothetical protein
MDADAPANGHTNQGRHQEQGAPTDGGDSLFFQAFNYHRLGSCGELCSGSKRAEGASIGPGRPTSRGCKWRQSDWGEESITLIYC